jgi:hypothetical protein
MSGWLSAESRRPRDGKRRSGRFVTLIGPQRPAPSGTRYTGARVSELCRAQLCTVTLTGRCCSHMLWGYRLLQRNAEHSPVIGGELSSFDDEFPIGELVFLPSLEEDGDAGAGQLKNLYYECSRKCDERTLR